VVFVTAFPSFYSIDRLASNARFQDLCRRVLEGAREVLEQFIRYVPAVDDAGGDGVGHGGIVRPAGVPDEEVHGRALMERVNEVTEFKAGDLPATTARTPWWSMSDGSLTP
jgi:hypothetical protein